MATYENYVKYDMLVCLIRSNGNSETTELYKCVNYYCYEIFYFQFRGMLVVYPEERQLFFRHMVV